MGLVNFLFSPVAGMVALGVIWVGSVMGTLLDARRRIVNRAARSLVVAAAILLPLLGALLYRMLRPPETLLERQHKRHARRLFEQLGENQPRSTSSARRLDKKRASGSTKRALARAARSTRTKD